MKTTVLILAGLLGVILVLFLVRQISQLANGDSPLQEIVVTRDNPDFPPSCRPREVARVLMRFFDAINTGDQGQLAAFLGSEFDFFAVIEEDSRNGRRGVLFYDSQTSSLRLSEATSLTLYVRSPDDLLSYFAERYRQHERLQLLEVSIGYESERGLAQLAFIVTRQADDLAAGLGGPDHLAEGKGAIGCQTQTLVAWTLAISEQPEFSLGLCPKPDEGMLPVGVIACARN